MMYDVVTCTKFLVHTSLLKPRLPHIILATGVSNTLLCAMYDVVNFTRLQISEVLSKLEKKGGSKREFCSHLITVKGLVQTICEKLASL